MDLQQALSSYEREKAYWSNNGDLYKRILSDSTIDGLIRFFIHLIHDFIDVEDIFELTSGFVGYLLPSDRAFI